ncbi:hypothetical protein SCANM63S_03630 [Streptomyces canarius]
MIPFVVVGGLLIAISLSLGGSTHRRRSWSIPKDSFWMDVNNIGVIGFTLMVPILSGYIAYAIGDRPALVPGMVGGWIANTGELYDSKAGAGFIGAIVTGFLAGAIPGAADQEGPGPEVRAADHADHRDPDRGDHRARHVLPSSTSSASRSPGAVRGT